MTGLSGSNEICEEMNTAYFLKGLCDFVVSVKLQGVDIETVYLMEQFTVYS